MNVAELIAVLQTLPQDLIVDIGMNQEYQQTLSAEDIRIESRYEDNKPYVHIGD
jgi:hypothetical protein